MQKTGRAATLAIEIADDLRSRITRGSLPPGSRLVESRVSREKGVSRAPVREAARLLESEGLLSFDPNKGFTVRKLTLRELADVFDVRICIERHAAAHAAEKRAPQLLSELEERYLDILAAQNADSQSRAEVDYAFHHAIVKASGNIRLQRIYDDAAAELRLILSLVGEVDTKGIAESHRPVIDVIAAGNATAAADQMEAHIRLFWDEVLHKIHTSDGIALVPIKPRSAN